MSDPLVTVITPVYNRARYLEAAVESVKAQTYEPVELIVVDDGSTDGSAEVGRRLGAKVIQRQRGGASAARNAGIEAARGDLIAFLDSDDIWPPDRLAVQVDRLRRRPDLDFVLAYAMLFVDPDAVRPDWLTDEWLAGVETVDFPGAPKAGPDTVGPVPQPLTMLVRKEVFDRVGGWDASYEPGEDLELLMRMADSGASYEMVPHVVLHYRMHGGNHSFDLDKCRRVQLSLLRSSVARKRAAARSSARP